MNSWSHSIDNASDGQDYVANATQLDNSHRADLEKANSNFDNRHRFVVTASYAIPNFSQSHPRLGKGWQLNTVVTIRTGNPFHLTLFDDYNNTGEFFPRTDVIGDPYAGTSAPNRFINLSAFRVPCTLDPTGDGSSASCIPGTWHFGSLGRDRTRHRFSSDYCHTRRRHRQPLHGRRRPKEYSTGSEINFLRPSSPVWIFN